MGPSGAHQGDGSRVVLLSTWKVDVYLAKSLSGQIYVVWSLLWCVHEVEGMGRAVTSRPLPRSQLQYPLKPASKGYSASEIKSVKIKPEQQKLEMTCGLDTSSASYDTLRGWVSCSCGCTSPPWGVLTVLVRSSREDIAEAVGSTGAEDASTPRYPSGLLDERVLSSARVPLNTNYAVGLLQRGELHLTPLQGLLQMRPSFGFLDDADRARRQEGKCHRGPGLTALY